MQNLQKAKFVAVTPPGAIVDNAPFVTAQIDTAGFASALILVTLGATDIAMTALKLQESDTSGSGFTDIAGTVGGVDFTLPTATDDNKIVAFYVNCVGRKRYLDLVMTGGDGTAGTYASVVAILDRAQITPSTATERGLLAQVIV
jgi:hypothetical protein